MVIFSENIYLFSYNHRMNNIIGLLIFEVCQLLTLSTAKTLRLSRSTLFESADISVTIETASGVRLVEAFNATTGMSDPQLMQWVSLGVPHLLVHNDSRSPFKFMPGGFYIYIETLDADVMHQLAKWASLKYKS